MESRRCVRLQHIGEDRDFSRYWIFSGQSGLFVQKGWMGDHYHYNCPEPDDEGSDIDPNLLTTDAIAMDLSEKLCKTYVNLRSFVPLSQDC